MRRPLPMVALLYTAGVWLGGYFPLPLPGLLALGFILLAWAIASPARRFWLLVPVLILCGWINQLQHSQPLSPLDLRTLDPRLPQILTLHGRLSQVPQIRASVIQGKTNWHSSAVLELEGFSVDPAFPQPALGSVAILTRGMKTNSYRANQKASISGVLNLPPGPVAPGLFDYASHLDRKNIHYQCTVETPADWLALNHPPHSLPERFSAWARNALRIGLPEEDASLDLLWSMTLGWQPILRDAAMDTFLQTGTLHIFAMIVPMTPLKQLFPCNSLLTKGLY